MNGSITLGGMIYVRDDIVKAREADFLAIIHDDDRSLGDRLQSVSSMINMQSKPTGYLARKRELAIIQATLEAVDRVRKLYSTEGGVDFGISEINPANILKGIV